ncbi:Integral membrane protein OS=Tsukamurella paurometabola (strain ATCC 8368 / DSM / CCUG 35730/ CIP 100753 / JCM 10117 / KCTC 9821 / NBRC 16120 / NCIMB 702349/ NCTC 13040) OX=521096 GN=Tpau_2948 PE=4 SV=1 [Tsukamurella paurometabola]|uniref:Uncharacterized protein n=1 Tax=Tsukamurella paurometabola (strain ATCC 8368 / DSM 20162 / CCUG 35730 / CIP 100753 / JCM 10117 / KCTC 9821 / NBRC 16120 / NCIMB 702349 / NCTC 13040) TaxID=521096 RepID=D5UU43_TSUPD|nr:hypothetical protein [Tsukamurella paurometabola]ADG79546.1 conserved hypothetical protein [Tsukamurella paurometabola DSM 20162]SUP36172.1 Uncharacterised protein [Tsukamurella paurometabola]
MTREDYQTGSPLRRPAVAIGVALGLVFGFLVAPPQLMGRDFGDRARREFPPYIMGGRADLTAGLRSLVDDWTRYHLIKVVFAVLLVALALYLGHRALALIPAVALIANVQGAVAPLSSAFSLVGDRFAETDGELAAALGTMRGQLAGGECSPAVGALVDDFTWYHLVLAVMAGALTIVMLAYGVVDGRRNRRRWAGATLAGAAAAAVVTAANISTALQPVPGLLGFVQST